MDEQMMMAKVFWENILSQSVDKINFYSKSDCLVKKEIIIEGEMFNRIDNITHHNASMIFIILLSIQKIAISQLYRNNSLFISIPQQTDDDSDSNQLVITYGSSFKEGMSFQEYLKEEKENYNRILTNQNYSLENMYKKYEIPQKVNLFSGMVNIHPESGIKSMLENNEDGVALISEVFESKLRLEFYACNSLVQEELDILCKAFKALLNNAVFNPKISLQKLGFVDSAEKELIDSFAGAARNIRKETVTELLEHSAKLYPDKLALKSDKWKISYEELDKKSNALANFLLHKADCKGKVIPIILNNSKELYIGIYAILKSGAGYLPIDPTYPKERILDTINDSQGIITLVNNATVHLVESSVTEVLNLDEETWIGEDCSKPHTVLSHNDLAYVIMTSGSTGKPKGVCVEHGALMNLVEWHNDYYGVTGQDIAAKYAGLGFDASVWELFPYISAGTTICVVPDEKRYDINELNNYFQNNSVSISFLPTIIFEQFIKLENTSLTRLLTGADKLRYYKKQNYDLYNNYGPTEYTVVTTSTKVDKAEGNIPIGKPIFNTEVLILSENKMLLPIGIPGELYISGKGLARGYLGNENLTKEKFVEHPFIEGESAYRTGDIAKWLPNGDIAFLGRIDNQIKIRGFRVELGEIEKKIIEIPGVDEAVVISKGEGEKQFLCGFYTSKQSINQKVIREVLVESLPEYMIPAFLRSVSKIPITENGKINRKALLDMCPDTVLVSDLTPPENEIEFKILKIYKELLNIDMIGVEDSFFEVGGHSLMATQLVNQIFNEFGVEIPIHEIFKLKTVKNLSAYLELQDATQYEEIQKAEEQSLYKASSAQKRIYILQQLNPESLAYNISGVFNVSGKLDISKLEHCFLTIIQRHEILRTNFIMDGQELFQKVLPIDEIRFSVKTEEFDEELSVEQALNNFTIPFDLHKDFLFRVMILRRNANEHMLLFDIHHIISDGFSIGLMIDEFNELYKGNLLDEPKIQYKDYAQWQNTMNESPKLRSQKDYLLNEFKGQIPLLDLTTDYKRPKEKLFEGKIHYFNLEKILYKKLQALASRTESTMFMVLLSAVFVLLNKYTQQEDIIIGSPIANRNHKDLEKILGMFVNTLPIRATVKRDLTFIETLCMIKEKCLHSYENQDYQFDDLVEALNLDRDLSRNPLFDVMFVLQNTKSIMFEADDLRFVQYNIEQGQEKFDLTFEANERDEGLYFQISYATSLFKDETIVRMADHLIEILNSAADKPDSYIRDIQIITDSELRKIREFNNTDFEYPHDKVLHQFFEESLPEFGSKKAVVYEGNHITYEELNKKTNQLARTLRNFGSKPNQIIAIMLERSIEMMVGILGILKSGAAYLPIDPNYPADRIKYMLEDSKASILLTNSKWVSKAEINGQILDLDQNNTYNEDDSPLPIVNKPDDLAYIIYTSGSTGNPKGVMIRHTSVINRLIWQQRIYPITSKDNVLQKTPYTFDVSIWELFLWYIKGATLFFLKAGDEKYPEAIVETIERYEITRIHFVPSMLNVFLDYLSQNNEINRVNTLNYIFASGEAITKQHVKKFNQVFTNKKCSLINLYGPTEAAVEVTSFDCSNTDIYESVPIGKPIDNVRLYIVRDGLQQPIGVPGELCIAGVQLAAGYVGNPKLTDEKFIDNPFEPGQKMYKTGDLARWLPDGNIEYMGRLDYQVKIRGFRIELGEIESCLLKYENVRAAVVIDRQDSSGDKYLCAYLETSEEIVIDRIREFLSQILPDYMIPSYFIKIDELPTSNHGKADRNKLPEPQGVINTGSQYAAPNNPKEELMVQLWKNILNLKVVGIDDNFFSLGGDSIKAIQIVSKLSSFGYKLDMKELFKNPTVRLASKKIRSLLLTIEQGHVEGEVEKSSIHRWFFRQGFGNPEHWNQSVMLYKRDAFDPDAVSGAVQKLVRHHDFLRAVVIGDKLYNKGVEEGTFFSLDVYTNSCAETDNKEWITSICDELQMKIDLNNGPLVKLGLFKTEDGDYLVWIIHHLVIDGVSWRILLDDFSVCYEAYVKKIDASLPPKTTSYLKWSSEMREYADTPEVSREFMYWSKIFKKYSGSLKMSSPKIPSTRNLVGTVKKELSEQNTHLLLKESHKGFNTEAYELMVAALIDAIRHYSINNQILIAMESHGREAVIDDVNINRTVGWFTSLYPVLLEWEDEDSLTDKISNVKDTLRACPDKGIRYGLLRYMRNDSLLPDNIEPEICFNYLGQTDLQKDNKLFEVSDIQTGKMISDENHITYALDFSLSVKNGKLEIILYYDTQRFQEIDIMNMMESYISSLNEIILHCSMQKSPILTVSDISSEGITSKELSKSIYCDRINDIQEIKRTSPMQESMIYLSLVAPESSAYHETLVFDLKGYLDIDKIRTAFSELVERYDILRSNFDAQSFNQIMQIIYHNRDAVTEYHDYSEIIHEEPDIVQNTIKQSREVAFDLKNGMLARLIVIKKSENTYTVVFNNHHILMDGWCVINVMMDLFRFYSIACGKNIQLTELVSSKPYFEWLNKTDINKAQLYWKEYLSGLSAPAEIISFEGTNPTLYSNSDITVQIEDQTAKCIEKFIQKKQITMNAFFQAAWAVVLKKYCYLNDIIFGYTVSGRNPEVENIESMIGLFINTIPMRVNCDDSLCFNQILTEISQNLIKNQQYDYYPLSDIQSQSELHADLIKTLFVFENYPMNARDIFNEMESIGFVIEDFESIEETNFDLSLIISYQGKIVIKFIYNSCKYSEKEILSLGEYYADVLKIAVSDSDILLQDIKFNENREALNIVFEKAEKELSDSIHEFSFNF